MSNRKYTPGGKKSGFQKNNLIIALVAVALLAVAFFTMKGDKDDGAALASDVVITKSEITDKVTFIPTTVGKTNMEIMAVKASDGTIRTAFNTCQVCNGSPRAYYKQNGDVVVCQNCGNQFSMDMIEKQKGGCNPIPILEGDKTDNGDIITIPKEFIAKNKTLFTENWKSQ